MGTKRDLRMDNLRFVLIYLVVFCHLIIDFVNPRGPIADVLYQGIYVFHMPAFVFVTGYFARFRPKRIIAGLALPYVTFQIAAIVRRNLVAGRMWYANLTLLRPQWTLWYLLACVLWYCTIPLLDAATSRKSRVAVVSASFVVSLISGFAPWLNDFLDLSRVVTLFPFFCAGYYGRKAELSNRLGALEPRMARRLRTLAIVAVLVFIALQIWYGHVPAGVLYRDTPFTSAGDFVGRALVQFGAVIWCFALFVIAPTRDLGLVSIIGQNTLSVYLLHPWLIRLLRHAPQLPGPELAQVLACAAIALAMLVLLGNDWVGKRFAFVFGGGWMKRT